MFKLNYRREIDGLRALAVIPVILFHADIALFSGGFVGVDIFFVISGYLITGLIISDLEQKRFSLAHFYERRARRILPALFLVMAASIPFGFMWMSPQQFEELSNSIIAASLFSSNMFFWHESGYFVPLASQKPLLHTWSLAVEEQYYIFFPLLLILLWRKGKQHALYSLIFLAGISLMLCDWGSENLPDANFYLAPTRFWELLAGSICAFIQYLKPQKANNILSMIGMALIVYAIFCFDRFTPFPSLYAVVPVLGTALIITYGLKGTHIARLLSLKLFVGIGLISYSAYLWHHPLFAYAHILHIKPPEPLLMLSLTAATFILAYFSWKYVETPFRKGIRPTPNAKALYTAAGCLALFIGLGLYGRAHNVALTSIPPEPDVQWEQSVRMHECLMYTPYKSTHAKTCYESGETNVLLWGDSYGASLYPGLRMLQSQHGFALTQLTQTACPPIVGLGHSLYRPDCDEINDRIFTHVQNTHYDFIVLYSSWTTDHYPIDSSVYKQKLAQTLTKLKNTLPSSTIILIGPTPRWIGGSYRHYIHYTRDVPGQQGPMYKPAYMIDGMYRFMRDAAKETGIPFYFPGDYLCKPGEGPERECLLTSDGTMEKLLIADEVHFSSHGSEELFRRMPYIFTRN